MPSKDQYRNKNFGVGLMSLREISLERHKGRSARSPISEEISAGIVPHNLPGDMGKCGTTSRKVHTLSLRVTEEICLHPVSSGRTARLQNVIYIRAMLEAGAIKGRENIERAKKTIENLRS